MQSINPKPATSPSNSIAKIEPRASNTTEAFICKVKYEVVTTIQALGFALVKMGSLVICQIWNNNANQVLNSADTKPDIHHSGLICSVPEIFTPYRP